MKDEWIASTVLAHADKLLEQLRGASAEDRFAAMATFISHLTFIIARDETPGKAMNMLAHQINLLDEEHPGTSRAFAIERLRGMTKP
jgi:hypothetical protein